MEFLNSFLGFGKMVGKTTQACNDVADLVKSAQIVFKMNAYFVMGLTFYGMFRLARKYLFNPLMHMLTYAQAKLQGLKAICKRYGNGTVIITGPTTGLGPAYCRQLILAGFKDFILIDEDETNLQTLKSDLKGFASNNLSANENQLNLETFVFDFDIAYDRDKFNKLEAYMSNLASQRTISILINNFGKAHTGIFENMDYGQISEIINGNINAMTFMMRFVFKNLKDKANRSAIINIGSATAASIKAKRKFISSEHVVYSASKTYEITLMNLLEKEFGGLIDFMNDQPLSRNVHDQNLNDMGVNVSLDDHAYSILTQLGKKKESNGSMEHTFTNYLWKKF